MMQQRQDAFTVSFPVPAAPTPARVEPAKRRPWHQIALAARDWLARRRRRAEERRALAHLVRMDGYLLRDIGVTRAGLDRLVRGEAD